MKKVFGVCMAAVLTLSALPVCGVNAEEATYALGDVDMDGVVTGHDTAMVSRYVLDDTYTLTDEQLKLADVNEMGLLIRQMRTNFIMKCRSMNLAMLI